VSHADLRAAFANRDDHDVGDAYSSDKESHGPKAEE
jgi:hypothetical protein